MFVRTSFWSFQDTLRLDSTVLSEKYTLDMAFCSHTGADSHSRSRQAWYLAALKSLKSLENPRSPSVPAASRRGWGRSDFRWSCTIRWLSLVWLTSADDVSKGLAQVKMNLKKKRVKMNSRMMQLETLDARYWREGRRKRPGQCDGTVYGLQSIWRILYPSCCPTKLCLTISTNWLWRSSDQRHRKVQTKIGSYQAVWGRFLDPKEASSKVYAAQDWKKSLLVSYTLYH